MSKIHFPLLIACSLVNRARSFLALGLCMGERSGERQEKGKSKGRSREKKDGRRRRRRGKRRGERRGGTEGKRKEEREKIACFSPHPPCLFLFPFLPPCPSCRHFSFPIAFALISSCVFGLDFLMVFWPSFPFVSPFRGLLS